VSRRNIVAFTSLDAQSALMLIANDEILGGGGAGD
jgi:hypothetical protein